MSRVIQTNQTGIHDKLSEIVNKHLQSAFQKPYQQHTLNAFAEVSEQLSKVNRPIILDSCCGIGDSSRALAELHSDHWVIGIDKSAERLNRERPEFPSDNLILIRADLNDFYRLAVDANWQLAKHCIFYPNPWPKSSHVKRLSLIHI